MNNLSQLTIVGALLAVISLAIAAVLLVGPLQDDRLALVFGVIAIIVPSLIAQLRSDQAASNTNGKLDARIQAAVHRANAARRRGDVPETPEEIDGDGGGHV